jgi:hypothetical protein
MGGHGPPPKHPSQRRRRNAQPKVTQLPADGRQEPAPPLPRWLVPDGEGGELEVTYLASTRDWWETVWASPMAAVYEDADVPALVRCARLIDTDTRKPDPKLGAEIRQLEDRYGLSPKARRHLQWEIVTAEQAAADAKDDEPPAPRGDPRLRALQGGAKG